MKRRDLFKAFYGAVAGATVAEVAEVAEAAKPSEHNLSLDEMRDLGKPGQETEYLGFVISWTGWKASQLDTNLAGQWIARKKDKTSIVTDTLPWGYDGVASGFPGRCHYFRAGQIFDCSYDEEQNKLMRSTLPDPYGLHPEVLFKGQSMALESLKKFLRENV